MGQNLTDVVVAGAADGKDRIACRSLEWAARQSAACFHEPYLGLDGGASSQKFRQHGRDAFSQATDQHACRAHSLYRNAASPAGRSRRRQIERPAAAGRLAGDALGCSHGAIAQAVALCLRRRLATVLRPLARRCGGQDQRGDLDCVQAPQPLPENGS